MISNNRSKKKSDRLKNKVEITHTSQIPSKGKKKSKTSNPPVSAKKRKYNNSLRAERSNKTQKSIIEALVHLLVERRGGDVQLAEVARRTGIAQRTIFRFFKDKKSLHEAMDQYLMSYLQSSGEQMQSLNFVGFAKNAFLLFDKHESLTTAYVLSTFGQEARALFRKKLTQAMIAHVAQEKKIEITELRLKRLALITSLVNAKIWFDIRSDFGFSGLEMSEAVEWAMTTLLENC